MYWKPNKLTRYKISELSDRKAAFITFRNSSGGFISRSDVRSFVFKRDGIICYICNKSNANTLDHVLSVSHCFDNNLIDYCNTIENLKPCCSKCNSAKKP